MRDALHILPADIERMQSTSGPKNAAAFHSGRWFRPRRHRAGRRTSAASRRSRSSRSARSHARRELRSQHTMAYGWFAPASPDCWRKRRQQRAVLIDEGKLRRGGACVDTEEALAGMKRRLMDLRAVMASAEGVIFLRGPQQRRRRLSSKAIVPPWSAAYGKRCGDLPARHRPPRGQRALAAVNRWELSGSTIFLSVRCSVRMKAFEPGRKRSGPPRKATQLRCVSCCRQGRRWSG